MKVHFYFKCTIVYFYLIQHRERWKYDRHNKYSNLNTINVIKIIKKEAHDSSNHRITGQT